LHDGAVVLYAAGMARALLLAIEALIVRAPLR
jgi:hypothetical protein